MVHHLDRMTISLLLEPIGREFGLSDGQRGLLAGLGYALPFAIAGIPLGMLIDRVNRVRLLATLLTIWSGLTALCALATGFWGLLLARVGVGAAESGGTPSNISILSDYFPPSRRSRAFGVYYMAPHLGTIIGFAAAGFVAMHYGWRAAFLLVGVPGLLLVLLLAKTVREPSRGGESVGAPLTSSPSAPTSAPRFSEVLRTLGQNRSALHMLVGGVLSSMVAAGTFTWLPPFMMRMHAVTVQQVGFAIALGMSPFAAAGSLLGGTLADRLGGYRSPRVPIMLAVSLAIATGAVWLGLTTQALAVLIVCFGVQNVTYVLTVGPSYASVVGLMPVRMRGVSAALLQVASNVLGFGVGVYLVGKVSDAFKPQFGDESLRYTMIAFNLINLLAIAHFLAAARAMARDNVVALTPT
jgi:predicted MFS family arabinose efflux permease